MRTVSLGNHLREECVLWNLPGPDKPALLKAIVCELAARVSNLDGPALLDRLLARESEQSTGLGGGLALPHATVEGLAKPLVVVARAREAVDFAARDARPVDIVFLLLSPPEAEGQHLRLLARLARIFAPEATLGRLRSATGPKELFQMLLEEDARHVY